jgi:hypothetical protein
LQNRSLRFTQILPEIEAELCGSGGNRRLTAIQVGRVRRLTDVLEIFRGGILVISKFKDSIKAGYVKGVFGKGWNAAENKSMPTIGQGLAQFQQHRETRGGYDINIGKIKYYVTIAPVIGDVKNRFQLTPHLRLPLQLNKNNIIRQILHIHFESPFFT